MNVFVISWQVWWLHHAYDIHYNCLALVKYCVSEMVEIPIPTSYCSDSNLKLFFPIWSRISTFSSIARLLCAHFVTFVVSMSLLLHRNARLVEGSKFNVINNDKYFGACTIQNAVRISEVLDKWDPDYRGSIVQWNSYDVTRRMRLLVI